MKRFAAYILMIFVIALSGAVWVGVSDGSVPSPAELEGSGDDQGSPSPNDPTGFGLIS